MLDPLPVVVSPSGTGVGRIAVSGAIGDGRLHPLSGRFTSLAEARRVFPSARDLAESLCGAAIQSAIDRAERQGQAIQGGASVFLPAGRYPLSRPLALPNNVALEGEGPNRTFLDNQNAPLKAPLIVNANPATARLSVRGMSLHGGTHGIQINVEGYVEGALFEQLSFQLQSDKNVECNKLLQMTTFRDCAFGMSPFGVYCAGWTANVVAFDQCSFESHSHAHLYLRGAEAVTVTGGRFEGGGVFEQDRATIDIEDAGAVNFIGVYFENTHPILLRERRSRNSVAFSGCHFTGTTGDAGMVAYRFDSDGIVTFGTNDWGRMTQAPDRVALHGVNDKLVTNGRIYAVRLANRHDIRSERVDHRSADARDLLSIRPEGNSVATMTLSGTLTLLAQGNASGDATQTTYRYALQAMTKGRQVTLRTTPEAANAPALSVRSDPATGTIVSLPPNTAQFASLRWTFTGTASGVTDDSRLFVDLV